MTSILKNDKALDAGSGRTSLDAIAMADQLGRLESLVDSMHDILTDTKVREVEMAMQLDKQMEMMKRLEQRLQGDPAVFSTPEAESRTAKQVVDEDEDFDGAVGLEASSFLKGWQQQRKEMLDRMSQQEEEKAVVVEKHVASPAKKNMWDASPVLAGASSEDIDEIQQLKDQLKLAMRDAEIELSRERAKISNDRLELDRKSNDLERREKEVKRKEESPAVVSACGDKRVSRLKSFLSRRKKT